MPCGVCSVQEVLTGLQGVVRAKAKEDRKPPAHGTTPPQWDKLLTLLCKVRPRDLDNRHRTG